MNKNGKINKKSIGITIIFVLICASVVALSLNNNKTDKKANSDSAILSSSPDEDNMKPTDISITKKYYFGDYSENEFEKKEYSDYLTEKYDIDFSITALKTSDYIASLNKSINSGDLEGIVQLFSQEQVEQWAKDGLIYPLDEFLEDNEVFNSSIPQSWKDSYTVDGELYAIAQGDDGSPNLFARSIRGDWLDALNLNVPETVEELYAVSYAFTYDDPDKDGLDNTFGMTSKGTWLMQDIFQAYDCRLNHTGSTLPIWNPNTEIWEDSMLKPEMIDCLNFLAKCADENVMDPESFTQTSAHAKEKVLSGQYGGLFYWDTWIQTAENTVKATYPDSYMQGIYALKGNITKNINSYFVNVGAPMVMTTNTVNPKETINWYLNIFYGGPEEVFTGRFGIMGEELGSGMFNLVANKVYANFYYSTSSLPNIVGGHPDYALGSKYEYIPAIKDNISGDLINETKDERASAWFDGALATDAIYMLTAKYKEPKNIENIALELADAGLESISKAFAGEISAEEAVNNYRFVALTLGAQEILDIANSELSKVTVQNYESEILP